MTCIHCGQEHDPALRVCPVTKKSLGPQPAGGAKTMFGVGPGLFPPAKLPAPPVAPALKPVPPAPVPTPAQPKANVDNDLALGKTFFGVAPGSVPPPSPSKSGDLPSVASPVGPAKTMFGVPQKPAVPATPLRLPTEEEARQNPDLVIRLDPAPSLPTPKVEVPPWAPVEEPLSLAREAAPVADAAPKGPATPGVDRILTPIDLPKVGSQKPLPLPMPDGDGEAGHDAPFVDRVVVAARSVYELLTWSAELYLRFPARFFVIAAMFVLPASFMNSCVRVGVSTFAAPALHVGATKVDFSARKAELAARIARSQAAGEIDKAAAAQLAALITAESSSVVAEAGLPASVPGWLAQILISLIAGLLISGLAYPLASGALAVAAADRQSGTRMPTPGEILSLVSRRLSLIPTSLLPAALLISLGYLLFVIPGVVLSIALVFVAHVVVFERKSGLAALRRSANLVKEDLLRVIMLLLSFVLAGFLLSSFLALFAGATDSRALAFVRSILGDLVVVAIFPIPSLAIGRIYLDLRKREGMSPGAIARSAR